MHTFKTFAPWTNVPISWTVEEGESRVLIAHCDQSELQLVIQADSWPDLMDDIHCALEFIDKDLPVE